MMFIDLTYVTHLGSPCFWINFFLYNIYISYMHKKLAYKDLIEK